MIHLLWAIPLLALTVFIIYNRPLYKQRRANKKRSNAWKKLKDKINIL